jgi:hypothetical protein
MERPKFEFDHELAAQRRTRLKESVRDAAHDEYRATTESVLRATAKVFLGVCALFGLLFLIGWLLSR